MRKSKSFVWIIIGVAVLALIILLVVLNHKKNSSSSNPNQPNQPIQPIQPNEPQKPVKQANPIAMFNYNKNNNILYKRNKEKTGIVPVDSVPFVGGFAAAIEFTS